MAKKSKEIQAKINMMKVDAPREMPRPCFFVDKTKYNRKRLPRICAEVE